MHRLGFLPSGIDNLIEEIVNSNEVEVKSVFSHLAGSENPALDDFTLQQIDQLIQRRYFDAGYTPYPAWPGLLRSG